jgi:hypothetical protein
MMNGFLWAAVACLVLAVGVPAASSYVQSRPNFDGGNTGAVVGFVALFVFGALAIVLAVVGLIIKLF